MKRFKWRLIGLVAVCLAMVPLTGCMGVPQSEFEALQADYEALQAENATLANETNSLEGQLSEARSDLASAQADLTDLQADYDAVSQELAEIKEVYPPRDFSSFKEIEDWLLANDVSDRAPAEYAEGVYSKALEIQEDALKDGYIVSAWIDYYPETEDFYINCTAVADGNVWMWEPETDELFDFSGWSDLLKVR